MRALTEPGEGDRCAPSYEVSDTSAGSLRADLTGRKDGSWEEGLSQELLG